MRNKKQAFFLFLLIGGLVIIYYRYNPASSSSYFPSCPTKLMFDIYCPGCGTQRAIHYLLHGQIGKAMQYNPLFVILLPVSFLLVLQFLIRYFTYRNWYIPFLENKKIIMGLFYFIVIYFVVRNLPYEVLDVLRPPEKE